MPDSPAAASPQIIAAACSVDAADSDTRRMQTRIVMQGTSFGGTGWQEASNPNKNKPMRKRSSSRPVTNRRLLARRNWEKREICTSGPRKAPKSPQFSQVVQPKCDIFGSSLEVHLLLCHQLLNLQPLLQSPKIQDLSSLFPSPLGLTLLKLRVCRWLHLTSAMLWLYYIPLPSMILGKFRFCTYQKPLLRMPQHIGSAADGWAHSTDFTSATEAGLTATGLRNLLIKGLPCLLQIGTKKSGKASESGSHVNQTLYVCCAGDGFLTCVSLKRS